MVENKNLKKNVNRDVILLTYPTLGSIVGVLHRFPFEINK